MSAILKMIKFQVAIVAFYTQMLRSCYAVNLVSISSSELVLSFPAVLFFLMQWVVCDIITLACPGHRCFQQRLMSRSEDLALLSVCSKRSIVSILRQRGLLSECVYQHDDLTLCGA